MLKNNFVRTFIKNIFMSSTKTKVSNEEIENFLQGSNPQNYIVAIESTYNEPTVTLVMISGKLQPLEIAGTQ